jgi:hypothetical protein
MMMTTVVVVVVTTTTTTTTTNSNNNNNNDNNNDNNNEQDLSLLHNVQTGSGAHPASYSIGIGASCPGGKAAVNIFMA